MNDSAKNHHHRVEVTWVPVRDRRGRTHMEARWTAAPAGKQNPAA